MDLPRIILVSEFFSPSTAATSQLMTDLGEGLHRAGYNIEVVTATEGVGTGRLKIWRLGSRRSAKRGILEKAVSGVLFTIRALAWLTMNAASDDIILIASNPPFIGVVGYLVKKSRRTDYIFVLQDLFPRSAVLAGILPAKGLITCLWGQLMRAVIAESKQTVVLSKSMMKRCQYEYSIEKGLTYIHNWSVVQSESIYSKEKGLSRVRLDGTFRVQYSGNFGNLHDIITILECARLLSNEDVLFSFIGGGSKLGQIERFKAEFGLDRVEVLPYRKKEELRESLLSCDLAIVSMIPGADDTVAPSKFYGILETGRPVCIIASQDSELSRVVLETNCGFSVEPGDCTGLAEYIRQLIANREKLRLMGCAALETYNSAFRREHSIEEYIELIRRVT